MKFKPLLFFIFINDLCGVERKLKVAYFPMTPRFMPHPKLEIIFFEPLKVAWFLLINGFLIITWQ